MASSREEIYISSEDDAEDRNHQLEIRQLDEEIALIDAKIASLKSQRERLTSRRMALVSSIEKAAREELIKKYSGKNYAAEEFPWSSELRRLADLHWRITNFRPQQIPIMNATLDKRDVFVIMPTGGGKSLTYQLPALLSEGITLVISPLISLIRDQVFHLQEAGVGVGMLYGSSSKEETKDVLDAMLSGTKKKGKAASGGEDRPGIKMMYVTPERIAQSKRFLSKLEQVYAAGRLARIVIDEAHW
ncbi:uncharacterized protein VTP21DRAFT_11180 [Calcarisporiella thermophila]|uniref:uncharacterized protein n=1 Tax=Calcarisporiella thermophila TaxID=911321 RepID=UPI003743BF10